jgi:hypothetical protein
LHDMVQKYSSGEISRELWFKYQASTELWDFALNIQNSAELLSIKQEKQLQPRCDEQGTQT